MKKILLGAIIAMLLSGCAGKDFSWNDAKMVRLGDNYKTVVRKMEDRPQRTVYYKDNGKTITKMIYVYAGLGGGSKAVSFILTDNVVTSVPVIGEGLE